MFKSILLASLCLTNLHLNAQVLPKDGPQRNQLIAMGFDIEKEEPTDTLTIATIGTTKITFSQSKDRLAISRYFNRAKVISQSEEVELLNIINSFNREYAYQFTLEKTSITVTLYDFGNYEPKTFAKMVRMIDKVNAVFDSQPGFYKLVNK
jgi:hypothetical protein